VNQKCAVDIRGILAGPASLSHDFMSDVRYMVCEELASIIRENYPGRKISRRVFSFEGYSLTESNSGHCDCESSL
jgi:hypothetical protein